jgi:ABC-type bacteriocin/lantibiotic exporter with double-glycine peptidase domain
MNVMKLDVPYRSQINGYMCGPATLQMVLAFFGREESQRKLRKLMMASPAELKSRGTANHKMVKAMQKAGFYVYVNDDSIFAELKYFLSLKYPVIVNYIEPSENEGHFAVVVGWNQFKKEVVMNDPWNGRNFTLSETQFTRRWKSKYDGHHRWLMVADKKAFPLGRQFYPYGRSNKKSRA